MQKGNSKITPFLITALFAGAVSCANDTPPDAVGASPARSSALAYHDQWRKLWEDHITWTRMVIIGIFHDVPGTDAYTDRLIQNYFDMEDALEPYYDEEDVEELGDLILDHLVIAAQILVAVKNGESADALIASWRENATAIATQMAEMNPTYWPFEEGDAMWQTHLDDTLDEAVSNFTGNYAAEIAAWERVHDGGLMMADFFSDGVIHQFPGAFGSRSTR
jgi:hypothetical protein